jgi:membrane-associated phospholipid phosphatase
MNKMQWYRAGGYFIAFIILALFLFNAGVVAIDTAGAQFLVDHRIAALTNTMKAVTYLGDWEVVVPFLVVAVYVALRHKNTLLKNQLFSVIASALLYVVIIFFLKDLFGKIRPPVMDQLASEASFSFPSGHVSGAMVIAGVSLLFTQYMQSAWQNRAVVFGSILVILVSFSRLYLGVHWLSDVLGSILLGMVWITITPLVIEALYPQQNSGQPMK